MPVVYLQSQSPQGLQQLSELLAPLALDLSTEFDFIRVHMAAYEKLQAQLMLTSFQADVGERFVALSGFENDHLMRVGLSVQHDFAQNQMIDLADLLMIATLHQDFRLFEALKLSFQKLSSRLMETAQMMVLSEGESKRAAKLLYLHRNTFLYRLHQFKDQTGIDLREDAQRALFRVYLVLNERV